LVHSEPMYIMHEPLIAAANNRPPVHRHQGCHVRIASPAQKPPETSPKVAQLAVTSP